eukprot:CAMPEP_0118694614 /NCGR_PEP_ID=MMETSP0800-20121206/12636_1 /TAXON_ID=210618 ORGANISM="Striatella unipunctata, Strain CCMP2910" /NCGR_SAMPLE_ID=MMETSP0800 /ASSEMBLY_ACC=CAM_ASM_000638 /LENGTH=130 /DNA_ID=CAMNT_0006593129 /DNA_START=101 /DNA_END=496 /DNA_ORIENTATION=+
MDPTMSSSIPMMNKPYNMMEVGPNGNNLASQSREIHPVDRMQRATGGSALDLDMVRRVYGSGLAMKLATERNMASRVGGRLPGLPQSNLMHDALSGRDLDLDFGDVLGGALAPRQYVPNVHAAMEQKLSL